MKKRFASLVCMFLSAILILVSSVFPVNQVSASSESLTIWVERVFSEDANYALEDRIYQFAEENDIDVVVEFVSATDFTTKLNVTIESGNNIPDVVSANVSKVLNYYPNLPHGEVTDLVNEIHGERPYLESIYQGTQIDESFYFVPFTSSNTLMYIRQDKLEENGITEVPTTWEEVFDVATQISDPDNGFYGLGFGSGPTDEDGENMFRMLMWNEGTFIFDEESNVTLDNEKTIELLNKYKELYDAGVIPPAATTWDPSGNNTSYLTGESGIVFNAATLYNALREPGNEELFENTVVTTLPSGSENDVTMGFMSGYAIMEASENKDVAEELVKYLMAEDWYNQYTELVAPVFSSVFEDAESFELWSEGVNSEVLNYAKTSEGYYGYPVRDIAGRAIASRHYFEFPIAEMVNRVATDMNSAEESIQQAVEQLNGIISTTE